MALLKLILSLVIISTLSCTEDLGAGKFAGLDPSPQGPPYSGGWGTKNLYQMIPGNHSVANGGGIDSNGNWYSVGYVMSAGVKSWVVRKSNNKGASWSVVDQFNYSPGQESIALGFAADKNGNIYVVGEGIVNLGTAQYYWIVRRSTNGGASWSTVDAITGSPGFYNEASAITVNTNGRILVTGVVHDGTKFEWIMRSSVDNGNNWSTVSTTNSTNHSRGYAITLDRNNNVYVCGTVSDNNNNYRWVIVKSTDNGVNFTEVDSYQIETNSNAECRTLALDSTGRIFAGGFAASTTTGKRWIVKRSNLDGTSWALRDDYVHPADSSSDANSSARSIAFDKDGAVYVAGFGSTFVGAQKYISVVRKSTNNGSSWTTEEAFQRTPNDEDAQANHIAIDSENRIFVSGGAWIGSWAWLIRGNP